MRIASLAALALAGALSAVPWQSAAGQPPFDYGIDFVTIGAPGNAPYLPADPPNEIIYGRGQVNYEYRIGRFEVTTSQWMTFVNTFSVRGPEWRLFADPSHWGAVPDPSYQGPGRRWMLRPGAPEAGMRPTFGIMWREAAMYCNWLHNGQSSEVAALQNGAYDTSTFTTNPDGTFNDQRRHHPDALFWIPTWDEWLKSVHHDPNRYGLGQEGWWLYPHRSDLQPIPGPPGVGETSAGYRIEPFGHFDIPLGAYPDTLSPWGLLDATGGAKEWTEETLEEYYGRREFRVADGNLAGNSIAEGSDIDHIFNLAVDDLLVQSENTLRIASRVPSAPGTALLLLGFGVITARRRRPGR